MALPEEEDVPEVISWPHLHPFHMALRCAVPEPLPLKGPAAMTMLAGIHHAHKLPPAGLEMAMHQVGNPRGLG